MMNNTSRFFRAKTEGFTLIETIISMTIMALLMTAVTGLVLSTVHGNTRNKHQLQALALAEEGVEAMRYIRDSNWLQNYAWDEGSALWGADFASHEVLYLSQGNCPPCWSLSTSAADGIVTLGDDFEFVRSIHISGIYNEAGDSLVEEGLEVLVKVEWTDRQVERSVELSSFLTDWK
jgi:prepilin-type N-terminal cleavage/methylation domain-containing protein